MRTLFLWLSFLKPEIARLDWSGDWCKCVIPAVRYSIMRRTARDFITGDEYKGGIYKKYSYGKYPVFFCDKCKNRILADVTNKNIPKWFIEKLFPEKYIGVFELLSTQKKVTMTHHTTPELKPEDLLQDSERFAKNYTVFTFKLNDVPIKFVALTDANKALAQARLDERKAVIDEVTGILEETLPLIKKEMLAQLEKESHAS